MYAGKDKLTETEVPLALFAMVNAVAFILFT